MLPPAGFSDLELTGEGATSRVFRATSPDGRAVALKRLHPRLVENPEALARFRRELEVSSRIQHPAIVRVHDVISWEGDPTIVLDFIEGTDLGERIRLSGVLSSHDTERIARELLGVLAAAHASGVIHRDLKPQNVRLGAGGQVYLLDFGSARLDAASQLTATGSTVGTPDYMAPELFEGSVYDPRVDLYGLGATLFECLAGHPPQEASSLAELALRRARESAPSIATVVPSTAPALAHLIDRCLALRPEDRFATATLALWALDHPETAIAYAVARTQRPPCLHCDTPIDPRSRVCPSCASDHPFWFQPGSATLELRSVKNPAQFLDALEARFPELAGDRQHVTERLAALGSEPQAIVSFVDESEARRLANALEKAGAEIDVEVDEGTSGYRLYVLGLTLFVGAVLAVAGLLGAEIGVLEAAGLAVPALVMLGAERVFAIERGRQSILSSSNRIPVLSWAPAGAVGATVGSAASWVALSSLAPSLASAPWVAGALGWLAGAGALALPTAVLGGYAHKALSRGSSPEPSLPAKAALALSVPQGIRDRIKAPLAIALGSVVVATIPAELAVIDAMTTGVETWTAAAVATETAETLAPEDILGNVAPEPPTAPEPTAPLPGPTAEHEETSTGPDPSTWVFGLSMLFPSAWLLSRRRRVQVAGSRIRAESGPPAALPSPPERAREGAVTRADLLALEPSPSAFALAAKTRLIEASRELPEGAALHADLDQIRATLSRLPNEASSKRLSARCIQERDPNASLKLELLGLEGRLEAEAAVAWSERIRRSGSDS